VGGGGGGRYGRTEAAAVATERASNTHKGGFVGTVPRVVFIEIHKNNFAII